MPVLALSACPVVTERNPRREPEIRFSFVDAAGKHFTNISGGLTGWDGSWGHGIVFDVPHATVVLGQPEPWGADAATGRGWLEAECGYYSVTSDEWVVARIYRVSFTVSGPALRIALSSTSVHPGDALRITPLDRCQGQPSLLRIYITGAESDWFVEELSPTPDGSWPAVDVIVPPTFVPGTHLVHVVCYGTPWMQYADLLIGVIR